MSRQTLLARVHRFYVIAMVLFVVCALLFVIGMVLSAVQRYDVAWPLYGVGLVAWLIARWANARGDQIKDSLPPVTLYRSDD